MNLEELIDISHSENREDSHHVNDERHVVSKVSTEGKLIDTTRREYLGDDDLSPYFGHKEPRSAMLRTDSMQDESANSIQIIEEDSGKIRDTYYQNPVESRTKMKKVFINDIS